MIVCVKPFLFIKSIRVFSHPYTNTIRMYILHYVFTVQTVNREHLLWGTCTSLECSDVCVYALRTLSSWGILFYVFTNVVRLRNMRYSYTWKGIIILDINDIHIFQVYVNTGLVENYIHKCCP